MKENLLLLRDLFIRKLKKKIFKHMKAISKSVYFHVFRPDIINKYNSTVHRTIK